MKLEKNDNSERLVPPSLAKQVMSHFHTKIPFNEEKQKKNLVLGESDRSLKEATKVMEVRS